MDGVLCDFTALAKRISGVESPPPRRLWSSIATYRKSHEGFYTDLNWLGGGIELLKGLEATNLSILTGCPQGGWGGMEKYLWMQRNVVASEEFMFDGIEWLDHANSRPGPADVGVGVGDGDDVDGKRLNLITCKSKLKQDFCTPGDVLIDDREDIGRRWEDAGGVFIHYKGDELEGKAAEQALEQLVAMKLII